MTYETLISGIKSRYRDAENGDEEGLESVRREYDSKAKEYCDTAEPAAAGLSEDLVLVTVIDYDREDAWGCEPYSVLVKREHAEKAENTLTAAIAEYYDTDFHSEVTGLGPKDLIRIFLAEADIPIIQYFVKEDNCRAECRNFNK